MTVPPPPKSVQPFIGRANELQKLRDLAYRRQSSIVVIKGRRRIGKSRLAAEFARGKKFLSFTGLAPELGLTDQSQRDFFARQLSQIYGLPLMTFVDWTDALNNLSYHLTEEPTVILFDEISWMATKDPTFIPKLKAWWDLDIQNRSNITLIFCGSISTWIDENILKSTSFFGRVSMILELKPLSIKESASLMRKRGFKGSSFELYKILAVTGGVPWYLEQFLPHITVDQNIHRLCFEETGLLTVEFDRIFHDLFHQRGAIYKDILVQLRDGMKFLSEIREALDYPKSGTLSVLMDHLITSGFVTKHAQWSLKTGKERRQSLYRINDPYIRFYFKYIEPNLSKIKKGVYLESDLTTLPGYDSLIGFQMECLLLQNRRDLLGSIGLNSVDCLFDNPYFYPSSKGSETVTDKKGCQIDYLIQTRSKNLYVCEIKFRRKELKMDVIDEVNEKIKALSVPKGLGCVPILFHIGGVSDSVIDAQYFYRIIDLADFVKED